MVAYLPQMDNIDIGIEYPPYEDPPPPYTPPKPPYLPEDEAPPPYDDTNGNVVNNGTSATATTEWIEGDVRQCSSQINETSTNGEVSGTTPDVNELKMDELQGNRQCCEPVDLDDGRPLEGQLLQNLDLMCMSNTDTAHLDPGLCESCLVVNRPGNMCDVTTDPVGLDDQNCCSSSTLRAAPTVDLVCPTSSDTVQSNSVPVSTYLIRREPCLLSTAHTDDRKQKQMNSDVCKENIDSCEFSDAGYSNTWLQRNLLNDDSQGSVALTHNPQVTNYAIHHGRGRNTSEVGSRTSCAVSQVKNSELEHGKASGEKTLTLATLQGNSLNHERGLEASFDQNSRPKSMGVIYNSRPSLQNRNSISGTSAYISESSHSHDVNRNNSTSAENNSSIRSPTCDSHCVGRPGLSTSQASSLSVCFETGEKKRPPSNEPQQVLRTDVKYTEHPLDHSQLDVQHYPITAAQPNTSARCKCSKEGFNLEDPGTESQINEANIMNDIPDKCEIGIDDLLANHDSSHLKMPLSNGDSCSVHDENRANGNSSDYASGLQYDGHFPSQVHKIAETPVKPKCDSGFVQIRTRKGRPVSSSHTVGQTKYGCKGNHRSIDGLNKLRKHDIPQFKQYGFIDDPEVLIACKDNTVYPEGGDKVLSMSLFEKLRHNQPTERQSFAVNNSSGYSSKTNERSSHSSTELMDSLERIPKQQQDSAVHINNHQCSERMKINLMPRLMANRKSDESNKSHLHKQRKKHKWCPKEFKSKKSKSSSVTKPLDIKETRDILNNNLVDNYSSLNTAKMSINCDTVGICNVDNHSKWILDSEMCKSSDPSCTD